MYDGRLNVSLLRSPLIAFAIALSLAVGILWQSSRYYSEMSSQYSTAKAEYEALRSAVQLARDESDTYARYSQPFAQLKVLGFLADEPRLAWIETIKTAVSALKLGDFHYGISAQREINSLDLGMAPEIVLRVSEMQLTFALLHEGDLIAIERALQLAKVGLFSTDGCQISRLRVLQNDGQPNFTASCSLSWYSATLKNAFAENDSMEII